MEVGDVVQTVGLLVNAGLLAGVAYELRTAAVTRKQDIDASKRQATLDTWRAVSVELSEAEASLWQALGRLRMTTDDARRIFSAQERRRSVKELSGDRSDIEALQAYESIRAILNTLDNYAVGVEVGAYDQETSYRISGWRAARTYDRYEAVIEYWRRLIPDEREPLYSSLEDFVRRFLASRHESQLPIRWPFPERTLKDIEAQSSRAKE